MEPAGWRTVRVFISSTFRDMQAERDHLVRFVFPRLREELLKRRIHLVDVDLRWGVTSEQDALEVCREIINECRPRFICILGGRYGWVPPGREHSITADEVRYGVLERLAQKEYRYFYFRDPQATELIPETAARTGGYREFATPEDVEHYGDQRAQELASDRTRKLADLKHAVEDAAFTPFVYPTRWDESSQRLVGLELFGERVYADLLASVDDEFGVEQPAPLDEFAEEDAAMEAFVEERVERYVVGSRQSVFDELTAFAQAEGEPNVALVTGAPGCGKSALLGRFTQDYALGHPDDLVIAHFVGASAGSTDLRRTLRRLSHALVKATGSQQEIPQEAKELITRLPEWLAEAAASRRVVIVLDALNQLDSTDNAHTMYWLPRNLPTNVRVIVSSLEHPALEALRRRRKAIREIEVQPLTPGDARTIIEGFFQRYRKRMSKEQIAALLGKGEAGNPLYLLAALEELRTLGTYEEISGRLRELPGETRALFGWILQRLEGDPGFRDAEGQLVGAGIVREFASCLAVSRHGLSQMELAELIAPGNANADPPIPADAEGNVAALIRLLRPYLMQRGELLDFYHGQLGDAVEAEYLDEEHERLTAHRHLADYFRGKADPHQNRSWRGEVARPFLELPFHMVTARMGATLESTLSDFKFLDAKLVTCGPRELLKDFDQALSPPQRGLANVEALGLIAQALRLCADILANDPHQLAAQLIGRLLNQRVPMLQDLMLSAAREGGRGEPWLRPIRRCLPLGSPRLVASVRSPHLDAIQGFVITPDGEKLVSWDVDSLCAWSTDGLECLGGHRAPGYGCAVKAIAALPDSQRIVFALDDTRNTLFTWDIETNGVEEFLNSREPVESIAVVNDLLVIAGGKRPPQVWSTLGREWLGWAPCDGDHSAMRVAATPDGSALIGVAEELICRWALPGLELQFKRRVPALRVDRICVTADGRWLLTVAGITHGDRAVRIFDAQTGEPWRSLQGHTGGVVCVAVEPDQGWVYSASRDQGVGIWDFPTGRLLRMVKDADVWALAVTPSGALVTAGGLRVIQLWDRRSFGLCYEGDVAGAVDAVAVDGRGVSLIAVSKGEPPLRWVEGTCTPVPLEVTVLRLALTDDGGIALAASGRGEIVIWSTSEGRPVGQLEGEGPTVTFLVISQSGEVVVAREDGAIRVWHIGDTLRPRCLVSGAVARNPLAVSPDGQTAVCMGSHVYDDLGVYDVKSGRLRRHLCHGKGHRTLGAVAISGDGTRVALASGSWRTQGGSIVSVERLDERGETIGELEDRTDHVSGLALSRDGKRLVICDVSGTLLLWDIERRKLIRHYGSAAFRVCDISRDGKRVVAGDSDGFIHLLEIATGQSSTGSIIQYGHPSPEIGLVHERQTRPEGSERPISDSCTTEDWQRVTAEALAAVRSGISNEVVRLLAAYPGLIDRGICLGCTLLHYAVEDGHHDITRVLIEDGADVHAKDKRDSTPLHRAAYKGDAHIAELLLTAGASIDALDDLGMAPIHVAAFEGHTSVVKSLFARASAPVDQRDSSNRTPLHHAASGCCVETAIFLLSQGADVNAVADDGGTPLDWAWHRRDARSMIELLREHGGKLKKTG